MFTWIVRYIIKPFFNALKTELGWMSNDTSMGEGLKEQLEKLSKDQIKLLLDDKLAKEVFSLRADLGALDGEKSGLQQQVTVLREKNTNLETAISTLQHEVQVMGRLLRAIQAGKTLKKVATPEEVNTDVLEF